MILVAGDIHADWDSLRRLVDEQEPEMILQAGDFGYWPNHPIHAFPDTSAWPPVHWCDGNHEDHWTLAKRESDEVAPNLIYQPRGSTLTLPDGRRVLFLGGATSVDRLGRTLGLDWFPEEVPGYEVLGLLDFTGGPIDIVISHTCPQEFDIKSGRSGEEIRHRDPTRDLLSYVLDTFRPSQWYFGHWHVRKSGDAMGCHWTALSSTAWGGWWTRLR